jgi:hypothetical protein
VQRAAHNPARPGCNNKPIEVPEHIAAVIRRERAGRKHAGRKHAGRKHATRQLLIAAVPAIQ